MEDRDSGEAKQRELCNVVNQNTIKITEAPKTEGCGKSSDVSDIKIYPQMRTISGYFTGGYENWQDAAYSIKTKRFLRRPALDIIKVQTRKESGFQYKQRAVDRPTTLQELKTWTTSEKDQTTYRVTAIVSGAGTGKTTLLNRLARESAEKCLSEDSTSKNPPKMAQFIDLRVMKYEENMTPSQFLLGGLYSEEKDREDAYKWLLSRQSEAIIYFDGFEQTDWSINRLGHRKINPWDKATTAEIMYNILSRDLLPHVKIMMTSREFKISELPEETRDLRVISLEGFKFEDAKELFIDLVGPRGLEIWDGMIESHKLTDILTIPVVIKLLAAATVQDPSRPTPVTKTKLYDLIVLSFRGKTVDHRENDQFLKTLTKFKAMAYQGMVEGRVVFYEADLKKFNISLSEARDIMITVPGNDSLSHRLLQGDSVLYFCHQSLQEFLAASFVAEMDFMDFEEFHHKHSERAHMSTVRIFLCGIVLGYVPYMELHDVDFHLLKQSIFHTAMSSAITNGRQLKQQNGIDLLLAMSESPCSHYRDFIQSLPYLPSMRGVMFGPDVIYMLAEFIEKRKISRRETAIILHECGIDDTLISIIFKEFRQKQLIIDVKSLDLRWNSFSANGLDILLNVFKAKTISIDYTRYKIIRREFLQDRGASLPNLDFFRLYVNLRNGRERMLSEHDGSWLKIATSTTYYMHELHPAGGYSYEKTPGCCL